ncbi:hypothetical protein N1851_034017 [Merluccius polli]|uniref:TTF-type domain-containing protein n=1 Tax=Merluccius polli TaxID=89951 RepID=A0AA47M0L5_MERPO|nr:hypothetical protein N1851_034017 [Merluccius polli]
MTGYWLHRAYAKDFSCKDFFYHVIIRRDWLEYFVKADAAFCYPCRKFSSQTVHLGQGTQPLPQKASCEWKHAIETNKGFQRHPTSKKHLACYTMWRERESRSEKDK